MSTFMYAYPEVFDGSRWRLINPPAFDEDDDAVVPVNAWPHWSRDTSVWYCDVSGQRGLPRDMDERLTDYIAKFWTADSFGDEAVCASWMSYGEILREFERDAEGRHSHFTASHFSAAHPGLVEEKDCRMTFWIDQR